ncbi:MAG: xanthine dehydrogenase family protein subunit M [Planctomycetes bacterium]|nr:xanthine dehydrogenase family protein subunit M [Planctomycetota bacterium]
MRGIGAYLRPRSVEEALDAKASIDGSRWLAGGTDLLIGVKDGKERPAALVSLRSVTEMRGVWHDGSVRIGAGTPIADCLEDPRLAVRLPVLAQAMTTMGSVQIRNAATIGGNLCTASPCADTAPPLLVLGARLVVRSATAGGTREIALDEFFRGPRRTVLGPHDVVTGIVIDPPAASVRGVFLKKTRVQMDLSLASVAVLLDLDGDRCRKARVAVGSVAPTPRRLLEVERVLEGEQLSREVVAHAAQIARDAVAPICDLRAGDEYRRHVTGVFVRRAIEMLLAGRCS